MGKSKDKHIKPKKTKSEKDERIEALQEQNAMLREKLKKAELLAEKYKQEAERVVMKSQKEGD